MDTTTLAILVVASSFVLSFVACWLALTQYHTSVLQPQLDTVLTILNHVRIEMVPAGESAMWKYHEERLMPALQLLASQRVSFEPPTPSFPAEVEQAARSAARPQLKEDEIESIWDKVKATY